MKIDIPFEIGDPVLIEYNQHDGYYINCRPFRWSGDIPNGNTNIFKTRKEAEKALTEKER